MSTDHLAQKMIGPWDTSSRCNFALAPPHEPLEGGDRPIIYDDYGG